MEVGSSTLEPSNLNGPPNLLLPNAAHLDRQPSSMGYYLPGRLKLFCCLEHCGDGCRGEGGVALGGSGGAGEEGVDDVVEEGLLLESGW